MRLAEYLNELNKIELLSLESEQRLWRGYKEQSDPECRRKLIEAYQPLVFKYAARWQADETILMDVIQEGTVGLIEAVENYDHIRGVAFSLYAMHRIRGRMLNYLEREGRRDLACMDGTMEDEADAAYLHPSAAQERNVAQQAEFNYVLSQVKNAMMRLPLKEQMVLQGVYLDEQEPKQLAEQLQISISHIYRLQKQGICRIRGMLAKFMANWQ